MQTTNDSPADYITQRLHAAVAGDPQAMDEVAMFVQAQRGEDLDDVIRLIYRAGQQAHA